MALQPAFAIPVAFHVSITPGEAPASRPAAKLRKILQEIAMLSTNPQHAYLGQTSPWQPTYPQGGVAPLRSDLVLARYLEKRAAHVRPRLWDGLFSRLVTRLFRRKQRLGGQMIQVRAVLR